jgi:ankyrin repeat protein
MHGRGGGGAGREGTMAGRGRGGRREKRRRKRRTMGGGKRKEKNNRTLLEEGEGKGILRSTVSSSVVLYLLPFSLLDIQSSLAPPSESKADTTLRNWAEFTPLREAAYRGEEAVALALITEFECDTNTVDEWGKTLLHYACERGCRTLVRTLIQDYKADINAQDINGDTPLHMAACKGKEDVALTLITEFGCDTNLLGEYGGTPLHYACMGGCLTLVRTLIRDYDADINAQDSHGDMPLHNAAGSGKEDVALTLIIEFGCDTNTANKDGVTSLHSACRWGHPGVVKVVGKRTSPLATDRHGNTPLHVAVAEGELECVKEVLELDIPIMLRNNEGKTARDLAQHQDIKTCLDTYIRNNKEKIYANYDVILRYAKKLHSTAEHITRIFVIGNPGAGKSTFVEAIKREGFFESLRRVSESSVPLHTAGIVPSIHTSKVYGRILFYDFAGDPEYYSSHAAILENLASSNGDNIFIIVVNLTEDALRIINTLNYWLSFIQHQNFSSFKRNVFVIGSHSDLLTNEKVDEQRQKITTKLSHHFTQCLEIDYFTLDCCKPKSKQLEEIKGRLVHLTKDSPRYRLSLGASMLLGLFEKDFNSVTACSVQTVLSHIEMTGIDLPRNISSLTPILEELHNLGYLFTIGDGKCVILNTSQLTNEVHRRLFSIEAKKRFIESGETFNVGILPQSFVEELLPEYITKECLVHLQYCQEISQRVVNAFPSLTQHDSSQSFLFFPALCAVDKSMVSWVTLPGLSYSIGWLAQCVDMSCDYFPPRFLHVLLLRLVFRFTHAQHQTLTSLSHDRTNLKRHCSMWNSGVHWCMEEGVECMVELVNGNKGVAVIIKCEEYAKEYCISIFHHVVSCVMEAKREFCHSIKPQFYLLDPESSDYLRSDKLFSMSEVEQVLASHDKMIVLSTSGIARLERERIACLCQFTLWNSLFHLKLESVLQKLQVIVKDLYNFGIYLNLPKHLLDGLEKDYPSSTERRRVELVRMWMSSSPDPPCWWHLVQALKQIKYWNLAEEIEAEHSKSLSACEINSFV